MVSKALQIFPDSRVKQTKDLPYTISYCIRKRIQIDNLSELGREKMPPDRMIWDGTSEDINEWIDRVMNVKSKDTMIMINPSEIE